MNSEYDSYGIAVFKGAAGPVNKTPAGVSFGEIDVGRVRMFILAVLWRMSTSVHPNYLNAHLPIDIKESLRRTFISRKIFNASKLQVRLQRLHDSTKVGGISSEKFRSVVMAPFIRRHDRYYSIGFLLFGFLVEIFVPFLPASGRIGKHLLSPRSSVLFAPLVEFVDVPELFDLGVRSLEKSLTGLSRLADEVGKPIA